MEWGRKVYERYYNGTKFGTVRIIIRHRAKIKHIRKGGECEGLLLLEGYENNSIQLDTIGFVRVNRLGI